MPYIIAEPCIGTKDASCVSVCPVDCIYEGEDMYYINPDECIDCGACEPECPVEAIFAEDDVPALQFRIEPAAQPRADDRRGVAADELEVAGDVQHVGAAAQRRALLQARPGDPPRGGAGRRQHQRSVQAAGHQPQHHLPQAALEQGRLSDRVAGCAPRENPVPAAPAIAPGWHSALALNT